MMDQEPVRFLPCLAIRPERLADTLALFSGIREDQALMPPRMLESGLGKASDA